MSEPEKVFYEYPKWVYPENGEPFIVQDAAEEHAALGVPDDEELEPVPSPTRRGRPPGSKNKPKDAE